MKNKSVVLFFFILLFLFQKSYSQYISPGIRIGYDFNSHMTMGLKVSIGGGFDDIILNFTYGSKFAINNDSSYTDHRYLDLQVGTFKPYIKKRKINLFTGSGIGLISYEEKGKRVYHPRFTFFTGYLLFTTLDINIINWEKVEPDFGLQLVLPIPLQRIEVGSPGG